MAVTVVSSPPQYPPRSNTISCSHPVIVVVSSSVYGGPGITQHRFVAEVTGLLNFGTKYTVVYAFPSEGRFDFRDQFKTFLRLNHRDWNNTVDITQITSAIQQGNYLFWLFNVQLKEQYYNSGVFTEVTGPALQFYAGRGFTDDPTQLWLYGNWYRFNGLSDFMPYSGRTYQVYPQQLYDTAWPDQSTEPWVRLVVDAFPGSTNVLDQWMNRGSLGFQGGVYWPMYWPGVTDQDSFTHLRVRVWTSVTNSGGTLQEDFTIRKNVFNCEDEEILIMFQDRFHAWAFMSFNRKSWTTVNTQAQQAESFTPRNDFFPEGRYRYNVEASDTLTLNTDWMREEQNPLVKDLIATEQAFLVSNTDGSLEQVTVVPNSLRLQKSRNEGMIQYQMQFRKSEDNFRP